jgi:hypothetical protein
LRCIITIGGTVNEPVNICLQQKCRKFERMWKITKGLLPGKLSGDKANLTKVFLKIK